MNNALPAGWTLVKLRDVVTLNYGKALPARDRRSGGVPVFGSNGKVDEHNVAATKAPCIVIGRKGSIGEVHFSQQACWPIDTTYYVDDFRYLDPRFAKELLTTLPLREMNRASAIPGLNREEAYELSVVLPPREEQRRIVAKLEALQARNRRASQALDAVPSLLETLRQSILAAGTEGRLVQSGATKGRSHSDWRFVPLDELVSPGGIFDGARDHGHGTAESQNLRSSDYTASGVRVVRLENLGHLKFIEDKRAFISESKYQGLKVATVRPGDVLFGSFVEENVRVCVLPNLGTVAVAKADCFCVRLDPDKVLPQYAALQLASRRTREALQGIVRGATRPRITTKHLKKLTIPVCSLDEQAEIVAVVEQRLARAESIGCAISALQREMERLQQATLAKAFRGELIQQEPVDDAAQAGLQQRLGPEGGDAPPARVAPPRQPRRAVSLR